MRRWMVAPAVVVTLVACSSGSAHNHPASTSPSTTSPASSTDSSAATSAAAVQHYLDSVNHLCDALLPKVVAVTGGGSLDIPLDQFRKQLPAHQQLRDGFDRDLAKIPVPPAAASQAAALRAYIQYANRLDAARLHAAQQGQAAYQKEIAAESDAAADPSIAARDAAGFHDSCNAR